MKKNVFSSLIRCLFVLLFFKFCSNLIASVPLVDLEENSQDFVLETKRIEIPNYPHAFNASIIQWQGALLMSFRILPDPTHLFHSEIGLIWLDENFCPIGKPQILNLRESSSIPCRAEDARLICVKNRLWMVYHDNIEPKVSRGGFRMYVAELCHDGQKFFVKDSVRLSPFEGENPNIREKNWVPFAYQGELLLAYSLMPHRILVPLLETGECQTAYQTSSSIDWQWGELRGGTPGLRINQNQYLAFFHSSIKMATVHSKGKKIDHYFVGAYTFSAYPPFEITQISSQPIIGKNFYEGKSYKPYWHPIQAVFPCGFIFDEQYIWITYGRQDHEIWAVKLDKQKLLQSLKKLE